jgi:light-regulated signal transduction histidine kinase (bacteriophytochrome)
MQNGADDELTPSGAAPIAAIPSAPNMSPIVDLTSCDREPIHVPGAIQPHGLLFAFTEGDLRTVSVSANLADLAGISPDDLLGTPLDVAFDDASQGRLRAVLRQAEGTAGTPIAMRFRAAGDTGLDGVLHRHDGLVFLELEPHSDDSADAHAFFRRTGGAIRRLQAARTLADACAAAAREVRNVTGFDRVKIYRFASDFSGEVIAESRSDTIDSFLGLHFPPSDIPAQARALYVLNPIRIIPDIRYSPALIVPDHNPTSGRPIDLSFAVLRSVSPIHLEYMRNMGILGTMSVSILRGDRLWGLIACHNRVPRHVGHDARQACEMVAQVLAWQIGVMEEEAVTRHSLTGKAIQRRLLGDIEQLRDHRAGVIRNSEALLELMGASGLCLYGRDAITAIGRTPPEAALERLVDWVGRADGAELFQTDRLSTLLPEAASYADVASGVLAVPLSRSPPRRVMLWFRPEVTQTVRWGGNPEKPVEPGQDGERLQPRRSFAAWTEEARGRAVPWQNHEIVAAVELRDLVIDVILRKAEELEGVNTQLARSNEELESFAYVASHDLKEPLRHIEAFAGLLGESIRLMGDERLGAMVSGIESSSRRLRNLINDLAEFSRLGRQAQPLAPAGLGDIVQDVTDDLRQRIEEAQATIACDALPTVYCDRNQMRQVLQNLLSNGLKYRHHDRPCRIRIFAEAADETRPHGDASETFVRICVSDNGIGFDPKYAAQVFEPFQRLHGPDEYEGSGIGLAICRKIVQRHGGTVGVEAMPGVGSTFWFSLPLAVEEDGGLPRQAMP